MLFDFDRGTAHNRVPHDRAYVRQDEKSSSTEAYLSVRGMQSIPAACTAKP